MMRILFGHDVVEGVFIKADRHSVFECRFFFTTQEVTCNQKSQGEFYFLLLAVRRRNIGDIDAFSGGNCSILVCHEPLLRKTLMSWCSKLIGRRYRSKEAL